PLRLFRNPNFSLGNWVGAAVSFSMIGFFLPITIYLQSALGLSALRAGLALMPMSLISMAVAPAAGRLADRVGGKYVLMLGLTLFGGGMGWFDLVAATSSDWVTFLPCLVLAGVGIGCTF